MTKTSLHEIVTINETGTHSMLIEALHPYKKQLLTYYRAQFNCEPVLVVTDVMNAAQYGFIAPANEMNEAIETYLSADNSLTDEEKQEQIELISFQSIMLKDF